jgi:hypothetical protein
MRQKVFILYSLFFLLMCIVFSACSEADPDVISSTGYLILDYKDDHSSADIKLAAFAETKVILIVQNALKYAVQKIITAGFVASRLFFQMKQSSGPAIRNSACR